MGRCCVIEVSVHLSYSGYGQRNGNGNENESQVSWLEMEINFHPILSSDGGVSLISTETDMGCSVLR